MNDTNNGDYNNGDNSKQCVTHVSSRKGDVKGKTVSSVIIKNNSKDSTKNKSSSKDSDFFFPDPNKNPPIMSFTQNTGPPCWVSDWIEDVKHIKLSMSKLDQIVKTANMFNLKVSGLEVKINHIEPRLTEVERSCTVIGHENDDRKREIERARSEVSRLRSECINMQSDTNTLREKNAFLESKITDLESRSMRDNLLFHGIAKKVRMRTVKI